MSRFRKATKTNAKARVALVGPSGSGKTYTALLLARGPLARGGHDRRHRHGARERIQVRR